jgi:hypothetical protein
MAKFRFRGNPNVVLEFVHQVDILTTRQHLDYDEIDDAGNVIGKPKSDLRPEWDIPMQPFNDAPALKSAGKKKSK